MWFALILTVRKRWLPMCNGNLHKLGNTSTIDVNKDWKYPPDFLFIDLKRPFNWLKNKITKIEENLNENFKHCLQ